MGTQELQIRGRIAAGLGKAGGNVRQSAVALRRALGILDVYPGTLNVLLDADFEAPPWAPIVVDGLGERRQPFHLYPAAISGQRAWVARSLSQLEISDNVLEIIAERSLRDALTLLDGDEVVIELLGPDS